MHTESIKHEFYIFASKSLFFANVNINVKHKHSTQNIYLFKFYSHPPPSMTLDDLQFKLQFHLWARLLRKPPSPEREMVSTTCSSYNNVFRAILKAKVECLNGVQVILNLQHLFNSGSKLWWLQKKWLIIWHSDF